jgi:hypothetical protein
VTGNGPSAYYEGGVGAIFIAGEVVAPLIVELHADIKRPPKSPSINFGTTSANTPQETVRAMGTMRFKLLDNYYCLRSPSTATRAPFKRDAPNPRQTVSAPNQGAMDTYTFNPRHAKFGTQRGVPVALGAIHKLLTDNFISFGWWRSAKEPYSSDHYGCDPLSGEPPDISLPVR